jgi:hypothetical protein
MTRRGEQDQQGRVRRSQPDRSRGGNQRAVAAESERRAGCSNAALERFRRGIGWGCGHVRGGRGGHAGPELAQPLHRKKSGGDQSGGRTDGRRRRGRGAFLPSTGRSRSSLFNRAPHRIPVRLSRPEMPAAEGRFVCRRTPSTSACSATSSAVRLFPPRGIILAPYSIIQPS